MAPRRNLTDDQIAHVRWLYECDTSRRWTRRAMAEKFGVSIGCINNAIYYWVAPEIEPRKPESINTNRSNNQGG